MEIASPNVSGVTGLAGTDGYFLYHTELKQGWDQLLTTRPTSLSDHFSPEVVEGMLAAVAPSVFPDVGGVEVAVRRLTLGGGGHENLVLYRAVPVTALDSRVTEVLTVFLLIGFLVLITVLGLAFVAAEQITQPIFRLQRAAHALAEGGSPEPVVVETNDEIEDLGSDFNRMALALEQHRSGLEALVAERTARLREAEARLGQLVGSSADGIVGLDADERVELWNRGAVDLFGFDAAEAMGRELDDLLGPRTGTESAYFRTELGAHGAVVGYRTRRRTKAGDEIPVSLTMTCVYSKDENVLGYSVIYRDDRPRRVLEEQMRRSERLAAISLMAAGLAHELNNPLSVLGNRIELMQRDAASKNMNPQLLKDLDVLGKHVGRIGTITGDLLRFARDEADDLAAVEVNDVAERVLRLMGRVFVAGGVELHQRLAEGLPQALGNENVLETVLVNLLLNAQQATDAGGQVVLETKRAESGSAVIIEVRDDGPGVPPDMRRRIFEPFFTTKAGKGGTGLGLAVCRALVDRMGGTIEVHDAEEGGARFVLTMALDAKTVT
jgi:PAS domain S-box-containing protein